MRNARRTRPCVHVRSQYSLHVCKCEQQPVLTPRPRRLLRHTSTHNMLTARRRAAAGRSSAAAAAVLRAAQPAYLSKMLDDPHTVRLDTTSTCTGQAPRVMKHVSPHTRHAMQCNAIAVWCIPNTYTSSGPWAPPHTRTYFPATSCSGRARRLAGRCSKRCTPCSPRTHCACGMVGRCQSKQRVSRAWACTFVAVG